MPTTIQITTDNYDGQTAIITFTPDNGDPVVNIGSQVLPYNYTSDYYYGTYNLYFPAFDTTCTLVIENESPTICFEYIGQGPDILYQCSVQAQPTLHNGRYYWVLNGCPTTPYPPGFLECPIINNNNYIWWNGSVWYHSSSLGGGTLFTTLTNPGLLPIEILGTYEWTSLMFGTCAPEVRNSTLGSCLPPSPSPTMTPTMTPTPTPTPVQPYYVYRLCNSNPPQYIVQTQPGFTIIPGKVLRNGVNLGFGVSYFCWEFLYQTTNQNPFPPGTNVINHTGNFFTVINPGLPQSPFNNCTDCLSYVEPTPPQSYVLLGPYASSALACAAGNQNGVGGLGGATFSNNNTLVGSQVYNTPLFGTTQLVTTPGWYSYTASFTGGGIYYTIYIDNTGTITQTGQTCIAVGPIGP
jgi:hypothetical protein